MVVVQTYPLQLPQKQAQRCAEVRREAGACWNRIVELAQEHYRADKTWIGEGELKVKVKRTFKLYSQTVQALVEKYVANRETTAALRRQGRTKIKYPYRHKAHQTPAWKRQGFEVKGNRLVLKLSRGQEPLVLPYPAPGVEPKLVELTWENGRYYLHLTVEQAKPEQIAGDRVAAVDLGEIHAITMTDGFDGPRQRVWRGGISEALREGRDKPIQGAEVTLENGHHLVLLARNRCGYANLCRILTEAHLGSPRLQPRASFKTLEAHREGFLALSGCRKGEIPSLILRGNFDEVLKAAERYAGIFGKEGDQ